MDSGITETTHTKKTLQKSTTKQLFTTVLGNAYKIKAKVFRSCQTKRKERVWTLAHQADPAEYS